MGDEQLPEPVVPTYPEVTPEPEPGGGEPVVADYPEVEGEDEGEDEPEAPEPRKRK